MDKDEMCAILGNTGLSPAEITVYISLLDGAQSVQEIGRQTSEKRPTIYYSLNSLEKRGLVSKTGKEYGNKFQLEGIQKLTELINHNIRKQEILLRSVEKIKSFYPTDKPSNKVLVSYFDSVESIRAAIFYTIYSKRKEIKTIVPAENFFHEMGKNFVSEYVTEKIRRGIKTKALWEDIPNRATLKNYYRDSEIKQLPISMHNSFKTTIFIYDNKTLYIGPKKENYAVLIQSVEHTKMMEAVFNTIWISGIAI